MSTKGLTSIVFNCIQEDNLCKLQVEMKKYQKNSRQVIVSQKIHGKSPLFTACEQGKVHFINYLLDECNADVDQLGNYFGVEMTPLWYAANKNKLDVLKTLVQHGAKINCLHFGYIPVMQACLKENLSVVKYLVEHGADIHTKTDCGQTCLMLAAHDFHLCSFLITNGVDVNAQDKYKETALHYALRGIDVNINIVQLLLVHKSDYTLKNEFGEDALQAAALRGHSNIVETILEMAQSPVSDAVRAYELLGTTFVIDKNYMPAALHIWRKAMALRYPSISAPLLKHPLQRPSVYMHLKESENTEELINLIDPEKIYLNSLMIRERILGPTRKDTFELLCRDVFKMSHRYEHGLDLCKVMWQLKYTCQLKNWSSVPFNKDHLFMILRLLNIVWYIQGMVGTASVNLPSMSDVLDVLNILLKLVINLHTGIKMDFGILETGSSSYLHVLLVLFLHHMYLISRLKSFNTQKHRYMNIIHKIIAQDPRGTNGKSLLHLAVDPNTYSVHVTYHIFRHGCLFPSLAVAKILVECGANVDALQDNGNSPLYDCISFYRMFPASPQYQEDVRTVVDYIVSKGAHVDICNYDGDCALTLIQKMALPFSIMNCVNLKCLASKMIMKHKIPYKEVLPKSLLSFVELHGKRDIVGNV